MMPRLLVVPNPLPNPRRSRVHGSIPPLRAWHRLVMANFKTLAVSVDDTIGRIN